MSESDLNNQSDKIDAMPTKAFFVDMLTRDIPLERAVLDLVDNCVDGAKRLRPGEESDLSSLEVVVDLNSERFEIHDNCGGFDVETARNYAFRFGRPEDAASTDYSIGQFGVGMKRALFKFGRYFEVRSATTSQKWSMTVDVSDWERDEAWVFKFDDISDVDEEAAVECGTKIIVSQLRPEVAARFSNDHFRQQLAEMLRSHQRQFLASGLAVNFNGTHLSNTDLRLFAGMNISPSIEELEFESGTQSPVTVRIVAGVADSKPIEAGWYVVCNGRVVLSADRSDQTGWGAVSNADVGIPKYHNQYARFRGVIFFSSRSSRKLPWNTTKTGLDGSSAIWQAVLPKMLEHTRTVIQFLNDLDREIEEYGQKGPMHTTLRKGVRLDVEKLRGDRAFEWKIQTKQRGPKLIKIQYSREETKIQTLMTALSVNTAKAVGEASFDIVFEDESEDEG